jgi:CHASE1-domain containing sensor protein
MSDSKSSSGGVGFAGLLTIAFVVLKLCKVIDWSWWWVISPILISIGLALLVLGGIGVGYLYYNHKQRMEFKRRIEKHKAITGELQDRYNELAKNICEEIYTRSKWQQRMDDMQQKQKSGTN